MYYFYENETRPDVLKPINSPFLFISILASHTVNILLTTKVAGHCAHVPHS